jgi:hypothetical protein
MQAIIALLRFWVDLILQTIVAEGNSDPPKTSKDQDTDFLL